jgi:AraC-like DNA-binding protein
LALRWVGLEKSLFSSDQLPPGLNDRDRFRVWHDLFKQHIGTAEFGRPAGPFSAHMVFAVAADLMLARAEATITTCDYGGRRALPGDEERFGLLINRGPEIIHLRHRGREAVISPGASILMSRADAGHFGLTMERASWVLIDLPRSILTRAARNAEDQVGKTIIGGGEALRMVTGYASLILDGAGNADPRLDAHVSRTLLDLIGLAVGAGGEAAEIARERGLRAARIDAVTRAIADGYADPAFSVADVALKLGLSERYIQELLQSTGASFTERVMELRLQHSVSLLGRAHLTRTKVSDVALSSGFSDLSYFHRCFRRRFGVTPAGIRPG